MSALSPQYLTLSSAGRCAAGQCQSLQRGEGPTRKQHSAVRFGEPEQPGENADDLSFRGAHRRALVGGPTVVVQRRDQQVGQGGRGKGTQTSTFGEAGGESADKGVWMSMWVDDVDAVHRHCLEREIEITWGPEDMSWNVRELHIRHPDGHVFRVSQGIESNESAATQE